MSLISVIIPVYNASQFIKKTINSVLNQSYTNYEIIVVDDGSTDNTKEVLQSLINDNKIKYYYIKNSGVSTAANFGIRKAKGNYIFFLDHDDLFMVNKLKEIINVFQTIKCDVIYHNAIRYDMDKRKEILFKSPLIKSSPFEQILINSNIILSSSCVAVKKECIFNVGLFDTHFNAKASVQDFDMWLKLARAGYKFYHIDKYLTKYNFSRNRNASMKKENIKIFIKDFRKVFNRYSKYLDHKKYIIAKANYFKSISNLLLNINKKESFFYFKKSIKYKINIKFILLYLLCFLKRIIKN